MGSKTIPGIVLYVQTPNNYFLGSAGYANVDKLEPMPVTARMPNGSAGKKFTALLALQLQQEGLLDLDDLISTWLPTEITSRVSNSENMTLRQALNHTSGVYDYLDDATADYFFEDLYENTLAPKTDSYALGFAFDRPSYFEPGEGWQYSNTGYLLVGLVLDQVLGEHHSAEMRRRIFEPFQLHSTYFNALENELGDIVEGYYFGEDGIYETKEAYDIIGVADAPVVSTAEDMALFLKTIIDGSNLVNQDMQHEMFGTDYLVNTGLELGLQYGLGLFVETINDKVVYHHGGLEIGYSTSNIYVPELDLSITAFLNCGGSDHCETVQDMLIDTVLLEELF